MLYRGITPGGIPLRFNNMIYVPTGYFLKGITIKQAAQLADEYDVDESIFGLEIPQRKVYVQGFYINRYEVTNSQYQVFIKATGRNSPPNWEGTEYPHGQEDYPVTGVNWKDAEAFAQWSGKRLPTEEEWEKAARGTDGRLYPWGNTWMPGACRMDEAKFPGDSYGTAPVGRYSRDISSYGVFDMAGNVSEWTSKRAETLDDDTPGVDIDFRMVKGGSFVLSQPYNFRCTRRVANFTEDGALGYIGFRCAMDAFDVEIPTQQVQPISPRRIFSSDSLPFSKPKLYLKRHIQLFPYVKGNLKNWTCKDRPSGGDCILSIKVPYLPGDEFLLIVLEGWFAGIDSSLFNYSSDHTVASYNLEEPNRLKFEVEFRAGMDYVDGSYRIKNINSKSETIGITSCFNVINAPTFRDYEGIRTLFLSDRGFVAINKLPRSVYERILLQRYPSTVSLAPFLVVVSRNKEWLISQASGEAAYLFNNCEYPCIHSEPKVELDSGEEKTIMQKMYFLRGKSEDLLDRWRLDFRIR